MSFTSASVRPLEACLAQIDRARGLRSALMNEPTLGGTPLLEPLLDAVGLFEELGIPYALIGGIAAMIYGRSRFTEDVDFVAATGHEAKLSANPGVMAAHHFDSASTWKLYHASGIELDLWKDEHVDGITERAQTVKVQGKSVRVADVHDLIAMKLRAGRFQDDYDISEIVQKNAVDSVQLSGLITAEELAKFNAILERTRNQKK